ncbi:MAG: aspartate kinase [Kiritimatiellae bacterium]|nr:aspartate kinase [Kiritimatiellia bacterium]
MKVCKFGGSSLANAEQVSKIVDIVLSDSQRRIVVVSAPGKRGDDDTKVTDMLIECANRAFVGREYGDILAAIIERYAEIQRDLNLPAGIMAEIEKDLRFRLAGDKSHKGSFLDCMKAAGEDNSAKLVAQAFQSRGVNAVYVDPREAGMFLNDDFGNAQLLDESYLYLYRVLAHRDDIVIFPGFFGYTRDGKVATFPRGGSDITGSILAAAVKADVYENFTDVDSVYPVDPRLVPEVKCGIAAMTYREMRELSYSGFGIFHDEAVIPAVKAGIPINVRNTNRPDEPGTLIMQARRVDPGAVVGIACADGFCSLYVDKYMMNREIGFGRRLLEILEDEGVSYEHMPSGIDNVSVVLREKNFDHDCEARVIKRIRAEMSPDDVMVQRGHAMVVVVGEGMHCTVGLASKVTTALAEAGVNIEMMNQGSSEISMVFGVKSEQRTQAVQSLYHAFFTTQL